VVYRARQQTLQRTVALKVLRPEPGRKARARRRFCREAKLLASLRHRNIVAVHDLGEQRGWLWYSMDLAEGGSLAGLSSAWEARQAADLVATIAEAVAHVHGRGIIHCDLKPSNVLLDADGQPLLGDFGLAWVNGEGGETRRGLAGTPAYMAPEQIAPGNEVIPATDVWALGVILYELLAGQRPFKGTSLEELGRVICQDEPASLQGLATGLEPVWRRCLVKEPTRRFATAAELAHELRRATLHPSV
jgi:serine/threonine-protein kinase